MANNVNVFIKIDMSGAKTKAFNLPLSTTVSDIKQRVKDREGHDLETLMYRATPLRDNLTLQDYNFRNDGTIFASIRLIGGMAAPKEGNNATQFNKYLVQKLGAQCGASVVSDDCIVGCGTGCAESHILKCKFRCGCIYCADCYRVTVNSQIKVSGVIGITCGWSSHVDRSGAKEVDRSLAFAVCAFDEKTANELDVKLDENSLRIPQAFMKECFKCHKFMIKKRNDNSQCEECPGCHSIMCWICGEAPHQDPMDCITVASIASLINIGLGNPKNVNGKTCIDRRVCINKNCRAVNLHKSACNHMTCKCGQQYCHWCLGQWKGHSSALCVVKGPEVITAQYLFG